MQKEITVIVVVSLLIVLVIVDTIRESQRRKWYRRGYIDAYNKYSEDNDVLSVKEEAGSVFDSQYGFHYD